MSIKVQQYRSKKRKDIFLRVVVSPPTNDLLSKMCTTSRNCITNNC
eukprot:UN08663